MPVIIAVSRATSTSEPLRNGEDRKGLSPGQCEGFESVVRDYKRGTLLSNSW